MCKRSHKPSITLMHLNADSSFLLSYRPRPHTSTTTSTSTSSPFTILIDPWLTGPSPILHPKFITQIHTTPSCISTLSQLSPPPNIILLSQANTDHCHRETLSGLKDVESDGGGVILGVKEAVGMVEEWGIAGKGDEYKWKTGVLRKGKKWTIEIPIPSVDEDSDDEGDGEEGRSCTPSKAFVEITHHPAVWPWELPSLHSALQIVFTTEYTCRPPSTPAHNEKDVSRVPSPSNEASRNTSTTQEKDVRTIIYTPHGIKPNAFSRIPLARRSGDVLAPKVDVLLHPFNRVSNNWLMGGNVVLGIDNVERIMLGPDGCLSMWMWMWTWLCGWLWREKAITREGIEVGVLVSAHDEVKAVQGVGRKLSSYFRVDREEVERRVVEVCRRKRGRLVEGMVAEKQKDVAVTTMVWDMASGEARECVI